MGKDYKLPDPRKQPEAFLVLLYKTLKAIEYDDRPWDKLYFGRCMKRTQQLLENLDGDVQMAARCMQEAKDHFEGEGLSWTIETIIGYSFDWKAEALRRNDRECLKRLLGGYSKELGLSLAQPGELLKKLMALPPPADIETGIVQRD